MKLKTRCAVLVNSSGIVLNAMPCPWYQNAMLRGVQYMLDFHCAQTIEKRIKLGETASRPSPHPRIRCRRQRPAR